MDFKIKSVVFLTLFLESLAENCDTKGVLIYEDMNCKPTYLKSNSCPSKFDCIGLEPSKTHCTYKGEKIGLQGLPNETLAPPCLSGCVCGGTRFSCPQISCDPRLYNYIPTSPGCYLEGSLTKCCHYVERCPPHDDSIKCVVNGKEYRDGQDIYPEDSCVACICSKGWTGKYEAPFCRRRNCGVQLRHQEKVQKSCAPVYWKRYITENNLCCPSDWICPDGKEEVKGVPTNDETCKFGDDLKLKVGQWFMKYDGTDQWKKTLKCKCLTPPLLSCVEQ